MPVVATVKAGNIALKIYSHPTLGYRFAWLDDQGRRRFTGDKNLENLKRKAKQKAQELQSGSVAITKLPPEQTAIVRRILQMAPTMTQLAEFELWLKNRGANRRTMSEAADKFLAVKKAAIKEVKLESGAVRKKGYGNHRTLKHAIDKLAETFGARMMDELQASELNDWFSEFDTSDRTKVTIRRSLTTFFRWCRKHRILPDQTTEMERTEEIRYLRKPPSTYTPQQYRMLLQNVRDDFRPWLVLAGFMGLRQEETRRIGWESFDWAKMICDVPAEVAKTGKRRLVPIPAAVPAWLGCRPKSGIAQPICVTRGRPEIIDGKRVGETNRLGRLLPSGKWDNNALRHSFISYRAAIVGVATAAAEAGNSETVSRKDYEDAKTEMEAREWFGLLPMGLKVAK